MEIDEEDLLGPKNAYLFETPSWQGAYILWYAKQDALKLHEHFVELTKELTELIDVSDEKFELAVKKTMVSNNLEYDSSVPYDVNLKRVHEILPRYEEEHTRNMKSLLRLRALTLWVRDDNERRIRALQFLRRPLQIESFGPKTDPPYPQDLSKNS